MLGLRFATVRLFPYKAVPKIGNRVLSVVIAGPVIIGDDTVIAAN